jgi:hypothetical protein
MKTTFADFVTALVLSLSVVVVALDVFVWRV